MTTDHLTSSRCFEPLLLRPSDAAKRLAISARTLWGLTKTGKIPVTRINRSLRYDPRVLQRWIEIHTQPSNN
jgi:predicted site-specific integrase-resolvase